MDVGTEMGVVCWRLKVGIFGFQWRLGLSVLKGGGMRSSGIGGCWVVVLVVLVLLLDAEQAGAALKVRRC